MERYLIKLRMVSLVDLQFKRLEIKVVRVWVIRKLQLIALYWKSISHSVAKIDVHKLRELKRSKSIKGFTLVEVMVSIILLTISMLGLAGLQSISTKFDHQAYIRSQSVILANGMIDTMRSNESAANNGHYSVFPAPTSFSKDCSLVANLCTPEELATYDLVNWNNQNSALLPGGVGRVSYTSVSTFMVGVYWTEQEDEKQVGVGYVNPCDGSDNEELHCFQMEVQL